LVAAEQQRLASAQQLQERLAAAKTEQETASIQASKATHAHCYK
jgi:hypothetical protein